MVVAVNAVENKNIAKNSKEMSYKTIVKNSQ